VIRQTGGATDHQQPVKLDMTVTKSVCESGRIRLVVECKEPIDELAESMFEPPAPLTRRFGFSLGENAVRKRIFKLDRTIAMLLRVSDHEIGCMVPEDLKLISQLCRRTNTRDNRADQRGQLSVFFEKHL
jgi:hypothetical protein